MKAVISSIGILIGSFIVAGSLQAQSIHPALTDKHTLTLGAYDLESDTKIGSHRDGSDSGDIDLDDLGVDKDYVSWMLGYRWRFAERWALVLGANTYDVDGEAEVSKSFEYEGTSFEAGLKLESDFSVDSYIVDVLYSVYKSDRAELMLGGGLHVLDFDISFKGTAFIGEESGSKTVSADDLLAPLPNLRAMGFYAFSPKWSVQSTLGWMSVNIDNWDGDYAFLNLRTDYRFTERFGVGVGYQITDVDVTYASKRFEHTYDIQYDGPTLYLEYGF